MLGLIKADGRKIPLGDESVQCVVTSPPYWGLRKYAGVQELVWGGREDCGHEWVNTIASQGKRKTTQETGANIERAKKKGYDVGAWGASKGAAEGFDRTAIDPSAFCQFCGAWRGAYGLEPTVEMYVQHTVEILREIRRVLRNDGLVFWNIGDSYASQGGYRDYGSHDNYVGRGPTGGQRPAPTSGLKPKDLCLIPFRVALAAQADGWWVRSDIIWAKPNPMPESVTDRPTRSHEYILMLTKNAKYYWDAGAVAERTVTRDDSIRDRDSTKLNNTPGRTKMGGLKTNDYQIRNLRSVWEMTTRPYPESHFATFPEELPKRCILAATKLGDLVLDPFAGSGTVGKVAIELGRRAILCDLAYQDLASKRTAAIQRPLLAPGSAGWSE